MAAASAPARPWTITQITSANPKSISLGGSAAPHGRPRHGAVVSDKMKLRRSRTYYPGNNRPTRHTFGVAHEDFVLKGRWEDAKLGRPGAASSNVAMVKDMIADELPVRIEWGDVIAATGILVEIDPQRESPAHIAWSITIEIDSDDSMPNQTVSFTAASPADNMSEILRITVEFLPASAIPKDLPLQFGLLDSLDTYVSAITGITGTMASIAGDIDSFETATAQELNRLLGSIGQLKTAALTLSNAWDDAKSDFSGDTFVAGITVLGPPANSQTSFALQRAEARANALLMLAILADLQDQTQQALCGKTNTTVRARDLDTWESLSLQNYGSADRADDIRQANRVNGGTRPRAGRKIHLPK